MDPIRVVETLLLVLGPSGLTALATAFYTRRKITSEGNLSDAQAAEILSNASIKLLDPLTKQVQTLSTQLETANNTIKSLEHLPEQLRQTQLQLTTANQTIATLREEILTLTNRLANYIGDRS